MLLLGFEDGLLLPTPRFYPWINRLIRCLDFFVIGTGIAPPRDEVDRGYADNSQDKQEQCNEHE